MRQFLIGRKAYFVTILIAFPLVTLNSFGNIVVRFLSNYPQGTPLNVNELKPLVQTYYFANEAFTVFQYIIYGWIFCRLILSTHPDISKKVLYANTIFTGGSVALLRSALRAIQVVPSIFVQSKNNALTYPGTSVQDFLWASLLGFFAAAVFTIFLGGILGLIGAYITVFLRKRSVRSIES
jgi:hypothetical protein